MDRAHVALHQVNTVWHIEEERVLTHDKECTPHVSSQKHLKLKL